MSQRRSYVAAAQVGEDDLRRGRDGGRDRPAARDVHALRRRRRTAGRRCAQLPVPTRAAAAAAVGGTVYVVGGHDAGREHACASGPGTASGWRGAGAAAGAALQPRGGRGRRSVYVLGGFDGRPGARATSSSTTRAPTAGAARPPLPRPNHAFGAVAFGGEIWVIGGRRGEEVLREVLDPRSAHAGAGGAARRCRSRWSSSARPSSATRSTRSGSRPTRSTTQRPGRWREGPTPAVTRHAPRGLRRRAARSTRSAAARPRSATARSSSGSTSSCMELVRWRTRTMPARGPVGNTRSIGLSILWAIRDASGLYVLVWTYRTQDGDQALLRQADHRRRARTRDRARDQPPSPTSSCRPRSGTCTRSVDGGTSPVSAMRRGSGCCSDRRHVHLVLQGAGSAEPLLGVEGRDELEPAGATSPRCLAITMRCTSFVPSPISRIFWSR